MITPIGLQIEFNTLVIPAMSVKDTLTPEDLLKLENQRLNDEVEKVKNENHHLLAEKEASRVQTNHLSLQNRSLRQQNQKLHSFETLRDQHEKLKSDHLQLKKDHELNLKKLESANINVKNYQRSSVLMNKKIEAQQIEIESFKAENQRLAEQNANRDLEFDILKSTMENLSADNKLKAAEIARLTLNWKKYLEDVDDPSVLRVANKSIKKTKKYNTKLLWKYSALSLMGKSHYELMRKVIKQPMPCHRTLQRMRSRVIVRPGQIDFAFKLLAEKIKDLPAQDLDSVLAYDETSLSGRFVFDERIGKIVSENSVLVVQVRSINDTFSQTIFFDFGKDLDADIFHGLIDRLYEIGIVVRAMTSDSGPKNRSLWASLGCTDDKFSFTVDGREIHVFTDMSHNLKLTRDHLAEQLFKLPGGQVISSKPLIQLMKDGNCDILSKHLTPLKTKDKQKVSFALKVFNRNVTERLKSSDPYLANFMELIIDYFDIFNLSKKCGNYLDQSSAARYFAKLDEVAEVVEGTRISFKNGKFRDYLLPFQKSIIMSCESLKNIFNDLTNEYGNNVKIPTHVFSSDPLESYFGLIRGFAGNERNPTPSQFLNRAKLLMVSKLDGVHASRNVLASRIENDEENIVLILEEVLKNYHEEIEHEISEEELRTFRDKYERVIAPENEIIEIISDEFDSEDKSQLHSLVKNYIENLPDSAFTTDDFLTYCIGDLLHVCTDESLICDRQKMKSMICHLCHKKAKKLEIDRQKANDKRNDLNTAARRALNPKNQPAKMRTVNSEVSSAQIAARGPQKRGRPKKTAIKLGKSNSKTISEACNESSPKKQPKKVQKINKITENLTTRITRSRTQRA